MESPCGARLYVEALSPEPGQEEEAREVLMRALFLLPETDINVDLAELTVELTSGRKASWGRPF